MCGIVGVFGHQPVAQVLYDALSMLQHRGQDAAGIATLFEDRFYLHKGNGLITDVFDAGNMAKLLGSAGIGHMRYPTAGCGSVAEAQPFYVNSPYGIVFAHNCNLTNVADIVESIFQKDCANVPPARRQPHLHLLRRITVRLSRCLGTDMPARFSGPTPEDIFAALV